MSSESGHHEFLPHCRDDQALRTGNVTDPLQQALTSMLDTPALRPEVSTDLRMSPAALTLRSDRQKLKKGSGKDPGEHLIDPRGG